MKHVTWLDMAKLPSIHHTDFDVAAILVTLKKKAKKNISSQLETACSMFSQQTV